MKIIKKINTAVYYAAVAVLGLFAFAAAGLFIISVFGYGIRWLQEGNLVGTLSGIVMIALGVFLSEKFIEEMKNEED